MPRVTQQVQWQNQEALSVQFQSKSFSPISFHFLSNTSYMLLSSLETERLPLSPPTLSTPRHYLFLTALWWKARLWPVHTEQSPPVFSDDLSSPELIWEGHPGVGQAAPRGGDWAEKLGDTRVTRAYIPWLCCRHLPSKVGQLLMVPFSSFRRHERFTVTESGHAGGRCSRSPDLSHHHQRKPSVHHEQRPGSPHQPW